MEYKHLPFQISQNLGCSNIRLYGDGYGIFDDPNYGECEEIMNITSLCDIIHYALCSCDIKLTANLFRELLVLSDCNLTEIQGRLDDIGIDVKMEELRGWLNGVVEIPDSITAHIKFVLAPARSWSTSLDIGNSYAEMMYRRIRRPAPEFFDIGYDSMCSRWLWLNEPSDAPPSESHKIDKSKGGTNA